MEHLKKKSHPNHIARKRPVSQQWNEFGLVSFFALAACGSDPSTVTVVEPDEVGTPPQGLTDQVLAENTAINGGYYLPLEQIPTEGDSPVYNVFFDGFLANQAGVDISYNPLTQYVEFTGLANITVHEDIVTTVSIGVTSTISDVETVSFTSTFDVTLAAIDDAPVVTLPNTYFTRDALANSTIDLMAQTIGGNGLFDEERDTFDIAVNVVGGNISNPVLPEGWEINVLTRTVGGEDIPYLEIVQLTGAALGNTDRGEIVVQVTYTEVMEDGGASFPSNVIVAPIVTSFTVGFGDENTPVTAVEEADFVIRVVEEDGNGNLVDATNQATPTADQLRLTEGEAPPQGVVTIVDVTGLFADSDVADANSLQYGFDYTIDDGVTGVVLEWDEDSIANQSTLTISGMPTFVDDNDVTVTITAFAIDSAFTTATRVFALTLENTLATPINMGEIGEVTITEEATAPYEIDLEGLFSTVPALNNPNISLTYTSSAEVRYPWLEHRVERPDDLARLLTFNNDTAVLASPNLVSGTETLDILYTISAFATENGKVGPAVSTVFSVQVHNSEEEIRLNSVTFSETANNNEGGYVANSLAAQIEGDFTVTYSTDQGLIENTISISDAAALAVNERESFVSITIDASQAFIFEDRTDDDTLTYRINLANHNTDGKIGEDAVFTTVLDLWQQTITGDGPGAGALSTWSITDFTAEIDASTGMLTLSGSPIINDLSVLTTSFSIDVDAVHGDVTITDTLWVGVVNTNDAPRFATRETVTEVPVGQSNSEEATEYQTTTTTSSIVDLLLTDNQALTAIGSQVNLGTLFVDPDGDSLVFTSLNVDASTGVVTAGDDRVLHAATASFDLIEGEGALATTVGHLSGIEIDVSSSGVLRVTGEPIIQHTRFIAGSDSRLEGLQTVTINAEEGIEYHYAVVTIDVAVESWFQNSFTTSSTDSLGQVSYALDNSSNHSIITETLTLSISITDSAPEISADTLADMALSVDGQARLPFATNAFVAPTYTLADGTGDIDSSSDKTAQLILEDIITDPDYAQVLPTELNFTLGGTKAAAVLKSDGTETSQIGMTSAGDTVGEIVLVDFSIAGHEATLGSLLDGVGYDTTSIAEYDSYNIDWTVYHRQLAGVSVSIIEETGQGNEFGRETLIIDGAPQLQTPLSSNNSGQQSYTLQTVEIVAEDSDGQSTTFDFVFNYTLSDTSVRRRVDELSYEVTGLTEDVNGDVTETVLGQHVFEQERRLLDLTIDDSGYSNNTWNLQDYFIDSDGDSITYSLSFDISSELTGFAPVLSVDGANDFLLINGAPTIELSFDPAAPPASLLTPTIDVTVFAWSDTTTISDSFMVTVINLDSPV
ncbi:MAG: hypothetical protein K0U36_00795, partial [Alphaproteobacteria bacterium]|nr:hypothetical protein [Alphaproteobacteria bacterium]